MTLKTGFVVQGHISECNVQVPQWTLLEKYILVFTFVLLEQGWAINFPKGPHEKLGRLQRAGTLLLTALNSLLPSIFYISL